MFEVSGIFTNIDMGGKGKSFRLHMSGGVIVQVPLERLARFASKKGQYLVGVGGLISYQHMGSMDVECSGGCSCPALKHNMFHNQVFPLTILQLFHLLFVIKSNASGGMGGHDGRT